MSPISCFLPPHRMKAWKKARPSSSSPAAIVEVGTGRAGPWAHRRIGKQGTLPEPGSDPRQPATFVGMSLVRHRCGQGEGQEDGHASTLLLLPGHPGCLWGHGAALAGGTGLLSSGNWGDTAVGDLGLLSWGLRATVLGDVGLLSWGIEGHCPRLTGPLSWGI